MSLTREFHRLAFCRFVCLGAGLALLLVCSPMLTSSSTAQDKAPRIWTDSSGTFTIKATLMSVKDGQVALKKDDGLVVTLAIDKLSKADQEYAKSRSTAQVENPFAGGQPGQGVGQPAQSGGPLGPGAKVEVEWGGQWWPATVKEKFANKVLVSFDGRADSSGEWVEPSRIRPRVATPSFGPATLSTAEARSIVANWSMARTVDVASSVQGWNLPIDSPQAATAESPSQPIGIPPKSNFFEKTKALVVSQASRRGVIGYVLDDPRPTGKTRLVICDLRTGRTIGTGAASGKFVPLALHDNGYQVLMRRDEFGSGKQDVLELWTLAPAGITKLIRWTPYNELERGNRDIKWATFVDGERMASVNGEGKLVIAGIENAQPLYQLQIQGGCRPALSPNRKYLAFATGKEVGVLDLTAGKVVALQSCPQTSWPLFSFSPDGSRLACAAFDKLYAWDFADGNLCREMALRNIHVGEQVAMTDNEHVLVGNEHLVNLQNKVNLWNYEGHESVTFLDGTCWFVVSQGDKGPGALVPTPVPQPGVDDALKQALTQPDFFVLKRGTAVGLNVNGLSDPQQREKTKAALTQKLQSLGFSAAAEGTIELVASTEEGEKREMTYRTFGMGFGTETCKVREFHSRLKFVYKGETAWQASSTNIPGFISLKEGETLQQHLKKCEKPDYAFFEKADLPKLLMKPTATGSVGSSKVTVNGLQ